MEAKDTVMSKVQQAEVWLRAEQNAGFLKDCNLRRVLSDPNLFGEEEYLHSQATAKAQAEISFKAGIKEVVEWIEDSWNGE